MMAGIRMIITNDDINGALQRALKVEDVIEQEAKELHEEVAKLRITCKESDAKMHSQQEHSE